MPFLGIFCTVICWLFFDVLAGPGGDDGGAVNRVFRDAGDFGEFHIGSDGRLRCARILDDRLGWVKTAFFIPGSFLFNCTFSVFEGAPAPYPALQI
jgi:hypothetical protein